MSICLPKQFEDLVAEQVREDRSESREAVVRTALRQMEELQRERARQSFAVAFREIDRQAPDVEPMPGDLAEDLRSVERVRAPRLPRAEWPRTTLPPGIAGEAH